MTRLEIRTLARKKLGETTSAFWSDTEINTYINLGCQDIAQRTLCLRTNGYITTTAVTVGVQTFDPDPPYAATAPILSAIESEWTLSTNFPNLLGIYEVQFHTLGTTWRKLQHKFRDDLDAETEGWRDAVGRTLASPLTYNYDSEPATPDTYWWDYEEDKIGIYPPSDSNNATSNNLRVYYHYDHTNISDDADSPTLPKPLHLAAVEFVVATGFEGRGLQDKANDSWNKYMKKLEEYHINKMKAREDDDIHMKPSRSL